jgi:DNA modification methylase
MSRPSEKLFAEAQSDFFEKSYEEHVLEEKSQPVECLGMTFTNDEERRKYFLGKLREKLKDPEFRKIEGFPIGTDEDILALSDPPYYTACPNPFIADFIKHYGKPYDPSEPYSREPFAADVSEGKNDPIYNAHSYHTKVPHKAIMRYILHYTEPGDVVFDGFCGTGMTGVAAQMCGDKTVVESLGYRVDKDGTISLQETDENGKVVWKPFSKIGARRAVLNDLSPAATFIAYNYNMPVDVNAFEREAKRILKEVEAECGWMYETPHTDGKTKGKINYTVWSDVFTCPECSGEVVFWVAAVDKEAGKVHDEFPCKHCNALLNKRRLDRAWVTKFDKAINQTIRQAKQVPVLINYSVGKNRFEKTPDASDLALIERIEQSEMSNWFPTNPITEGDKTGEPLRIGITHAHHFYTKRNLRALAVLAQKAAKDHSIKFLLTGITNRSTVMNRIHLKNYFFGGGGWNAGYMKGTLYISSLPIETSVLEQIGDRLTSYLRAFTERGSTSTDTFLDSRSSSDLDCSNESIDYVFVDPPFGSNIMYSELNFLWEAWLKVFTNNKPEAIENKVQGKGLLEYQHLITRCFQEYYRLLKPGRWMTVEFHNSKNSVWSAIQEALQYAGFVIADVRSIDKQQGSFNQVTAAGAVKQDLIISAYKPNGGLEDRFKLTAGTEDGVWDFVRTHLKQLPVFVSKNGQAEVIAERQNYLLFDRMVAFHVQRGVTVPLSAAEFYAGLVQRFSERDGMYFLPEQVAEYDKKRMTVREVLQLQLFVTDESSAIQWLKQQLTRKPQTFQELHPQFLKEIGGWQKHEKPLELSELLEQNFLRCDGKGEVPNQIHSYLSSNFKELRNLPKDDESLRAKGKDRWYVPDPNKAGDLEMLRERSLLKEFDDYRTSSQKRLKVFRLEAVRAGFKKAWQDKSEAGYRTIIEVAKKIPENVLQEDPKLLMWYDQAVTRMGGE